MSDGKRGVAKAFGDIPVQMCHFHQVARYLTSRPKLEASIEPLKICRRIPNTTNALDGGVFSHFKKLIKLHQGLAKKGR